MKERERRLTHAALVDVLDYDAETGVFRWRRVTSNRVKVGEVAGQIDSHGHRLISVLGVRYSAHRLAWFYINEVWPVDQLDHINLIKDDNRIANLRESDQAGNTRNVKMRRNNKVGLKGVCRHSQSPQRFMAQIWVDKKHLYLGLFDTAEEAHAAYVAASITHHGEFGRTA